MFAIFAENQRNMLKIFTNSMLVVFISMLSFSFFTAPGHPAGQGSDCDVDTSKIAVVELTVYGMDSITISDVQDKLEETCGVSFNFACWADTMVFIEYDSTLTDPERLMAVIGEIGYRPRVRLEY